MLPADGCFRIFERSIADYHQRDHVDTPVSNPYPETSFEGLLYLKNWIDTVQWHLEDIIRKPDIDPAEALLIKRRIDKSNQERTDTVERLDDHYFAAFKHVIPKPSARMNSETPAWLLDRMSILMLKIYHMREQTERTDVDPEHINRCRKKLDVLLEQKDDMRAAYEELMEDIRNGDRKFKVYRQMKMYNDASLNPMLYNRPEPHK